MKFILDSLKWKNPFDAIKASWLSDTTYPGYSDFVENEILNSDLITRILDHITGKD